MAGSALGVTPQRFLEHKRVHIVVQLLCQSDSFMLSLYALLVYNVVPTTSVVAAPNLQAHHQLLAGSYPSV